jgi:hypothetical protein
MSNRKQDISEIFVRTDVWEGDGCQVLGVGGEMGRGLWDMMGSTSLAGDAVEGW